MRSSHRKLAWTGVFVIVAVAVVLLQSGGGEQAAGRDNPDPLLDEASPPRPSDPGPTSPSPPPPTWAAMTREAAADASDAQCIEVVNDVVRFAASAGDAGKRRHQTSEQSDRQLAELDQLQRTAAGARDPEMLLAALLLGQPGDRSAHDASRQTMLLDLGTQAASSGSPLLAWHALRNCAAAGNACPIAHLEQELLDLQRRNAEAWALVAMLRYRRRDVPGALAAMQGAARAPTATWHWPETVEAVERRVAAHTRITFPDSAATAFGAAAVAVPDLSAFDAMCKMESASSRAWAESCLAFARLRQEHNESQLARAVAYSTRRQALQDLGDQEGAEEARFAYELYSVQSLAGGRDLVNAGARLADILLTTGRPAFLDYLAAVRRSDELQGQREFLRQQAPAMLEQAGLSGREAARECIAELFLEPRPVGESRQEVLEHRLQAGEELRISLRDSSGARVSTPLGRRIGPDGMVQLAGGLSLPAAGLTTGQLQRDLAAALSAGPQAVEILVIPIARLSGKELRTAFDAAHSAQPATAR